MSILIADGLLVTQDQSRRVIRGNLYVEGGRIAEVAGPDRPADVVLHAEGCLVLPGLINCYTRVADALLGPPRDAPSEVTRSRMDMMLENVTRRDVQIAAALASGEMLLRGTTCLLDVFQWEEEVARAITQVGNRGYLSRLVKSSQDLKGCADHLSRLASWERVIPLLGCSDMTRLDIVQELGSMAKERGCRWSLPISERRSDVYRFQKAAGMRPVEWLEEKGLLSPDLIALQCAWLTLNEIRLLSRASAKVVHCPVSNQATGSGGSLPLPEMLAEGVTVGLGTDSPAIVGPLDMFYHMRVCALFHRGQRWDERAVPAQQLLDLCTVTAAEVLGLDAGRLQEGKMADLVVLDPEGGVSKNTTPEEVFSYLAYLARGDQVRDVVVDGKSVVEQGVLKTIDIRSMRENVQALRKELNHEMPGN